MGSAPNDHVGGEDKEPPSTVQIRVRHPTGITEETIKVDSPWKREIIDYTWKSNFDHIIGVKRTSCASKDVVETAYLAQASGMVPDVSCEECTLSTTLNECRVNPIWPVEAKCVECSIWNTPRSFESSKYAFAELENSTQAYAADGTPILNRELRQTLFATPEPKHEEKKDLKNIATNALYDQVVHCLQTAVSANGMRRFKKLLKLSAEVTGKLMEMEELASGKELVKEDDAVEAKK